MSRITLATCLATAVVMTLGAGLADAREDDPIELGGFGGAQIYPSSATSISAIVPGSSIELGLRGGYAFTRIITLEGEASLIPTTDTSDSGSVLISNLRVHALFHLPWKKLTKKNLLPFLSVGAGTMTSAFTSASGSADSEIAIPLLGASTRFIADAGLGIKFFPIPHLGLRLDARFLYGAPSPTPSFLAPQFEILFGVYARIGGAAPNPADRLHGNPPGDPDGDGIYGTTDKCPNDPEDRDGFQDADGCPDPDNDGDGVPDWRDDCPNDPEDMDGFQDEDGCPDLDNDSDKVPDAMDKCPNEPEDIDGFQDADGCPDPDNDGDGILDAQDQCPNEPETRNGFQDEDGCPDTVPTDLLAVLGEIPNLSFGGKADALKNPAGKLDPIAIKLQKYLTVRVEIGAHAGPLAKGQSHDDVTARTQKRAEAIMAYLVGKGVEAARLTAVGYGPDRPIPPLKGAKPRPVERYELKLIVAEKPVPPPPAAPVSAPDPVAPPPDPAP